MAFIAPAIAAISTAWAASGAAAFLTQTIVGRLLVSVATSALLQALNKPPTTMPQGGGISTSVTLTGGTNPLSFVLGRYATSGVMVCPPMSHGKVDKTPLAYLTYVIALGAVKGCTLDSVIIDDQVVTLSSPVHADYGQSVQGDYLGYAWVKFYDGSQTVADPGLIAKYASYPNRPWSSDMIGEGIPYAIVTFRYSDELWSGFPTVRFVLNSIPLYDIRKDSTAGGSGAHRWANPATWEPSENTFVQIYNIKRGITLCDGSVWGGGIAANDFDTASWIAAMNECDVAVTKAGGGTEAQFRTAFEAKVNQKPADVMTEFLRGSSGQLAEVGGRWKARAGGPGLPVYFFSDADTLVTKPQDFKPFPGLETSFNAVTASYPEPNALWETKAAPARYSATYEAEDQGRRRVAALDLPAAPYSSQVQRLMKAYIEDERRFRRHGLTLPPDGAILEPLDAVSWTSSANGYASKLFELTAVTDDLRTVIQRVSLRERDPGDYSYDSGMFLPSVPGAGGQVRPGIQTPASVSVVGIALPDAAGIPRRPTLQILWDGIEQDDVRAVRWRVRVRATGVEVANGSTHDVDNGSLIVPQTLLASTEYEARIRFVTNRRTAWTGWIAATTPAVFIGARDFAGGVIPAVDLSGVLDIANFATSIRPVEVLSALPATGNFAGRMVFRTTDAKLYRHTGSPSGAAGFTTATDGADIIANSITAGQIAAGAIGAAEIAAGAIAASKIAVSDFTNVVPGNDFQDPGSWTNPAEFDVIPTTSNSASLSKGEIRCSVISGTNKQSSSGQYTVVAGQEYWWQYQKARINGTQFRSYAQINWFDRAGVFISSSNLGSSSEVLTGAGSFTRSGSVIAPAGAVSAHWRWWVVGADTDSNARFFAPTLRVKNGGELIVDGAITADKIEANAVVASKIAANTIDASKIVTDSLTLSLFANGVLQTALLPMAVDIFTASNAGFNLKMAGLAQVWVIGGGGSGGAGAAFSASPATAAGGGAGGCAVGFIPDGSTATTYAVTIGAGGAGRSVAPGNSRNGASGGQSRFWGGGVDFRGLGGAGGQANYNSSTLCTGGAGGTASGGSYNRTGGNGGDAQRTANNVGVASGGGAPSVGPNGGIINAADQLARTVNTSGNGGRSVPSSVPTAMETTGFMLKNYDTFIGSAGAGAAGGAGATSLAAPVGCGSGGAAAANSANAVSGSGGDGVVIIFYYGVGNLK
jgi:hypothetical protein